MMAPEDEPSGRIPLRCTGRQDMRSRAAPAGLRPLGMIPGPGAGGISISYPPYVRRTSINATGRPSLPRALGLGALKEAFAKAWNDYCSASSKKFSGCRYFWATPSRLPPDHHCRKDFRRHRWQRPSLEGQCSRQWQLCPVSDQYFLSLRRPYALSKGLYAMTVQGPTRTKAGRKKPGSGRAKMARLPRLSRTRAPVDVTLVAWQRALRRQFGREQDFLLDRLGSDPVFSEFRVGNPQSKTYLSRGNPRTATRRQLLLVPGLRDERTGHLQAHRVRSVAPGKEARR